MAREREGKRGDGVSEKPPEPSARTEDRGTAPPRTEHATSAPNEEDDAGSGEFQESDAHCGVVGIGASAGGLEAFGELLKHLPSDTGLAFVFVQHLDPSHPSMLTALLSRSSTVPVREVTDSMALEPDHVYVIPPNTYLSLADGVLRLTARPVKRGVPMPVDYFLCSLAEHRARQSIGVVLSGTGSDGAIGLAEISARGGITFAQDEQTATYPGMPRAAVQRGAADFVLPPARIAAEITRIARVPVARRGERSATEPADDPADLRRVLVLMKQATTTIPPASSTLATTRSREPATTGDLLTSIIPLVQRTLRSTARCSRSARRGAQPGRAEALRSLIGAGHA